MSDHLETFFNAKCLDTPCGAFLYYPSASALFAHSADVAQLAEQLFCKQQVAGSSPIVGSARMAVQMSKRNGQLPEWTIGADCKSAARASAVRIRHCPPNRQALAASVGPT
jgi:hypothetical protein